jgi:alkanesulfonate monooxygenase SsuD/methylene tetrahydromethanopterin reductase-like flavin-dependent oxidoreductase (luciferase family)
MRDYVAILRNAFAGAPLAHVGTELSVPYSGEGAQGVEAMTLLLEPGPPIPIYVAASGTQMLAVAAEIADGWLPRSFAPGMLEQAMPILEAGFRRAGGDKTIDDFAIWAHVDAIVDDDVSSAMRHFKEYVAKWAGSQRQQMIWCGQGDVCDRVEELMAAGRFEDAVDAVPDEYIDHAWLVGPLPRIKRKLDGWMRSGATGLIVRYGGAHAGVNALPENLDFFRAVADVARR